MRTWFCSGAGLGVVVAIFVACGDDDPVAPVAPAPEAGVTPVLEAGTDAGSSAEGYTLDNVCDRTAPLICDLRKPCCGTGYDEAACLARQRAECAKDVAAARAGAEQFHPERVDACIPKYRELFAQCTFTWELLQKEGPTLGACAIFDGKLGVGTACERSAQCQPSANPRDFTSCDDDTKKCKTLSFLAEGDACALGDGVTGFCGAGLYCDVDFATFKGFCKKATSLGVPCDTSKKPLQLECGIGNYCDLSTGSCTVGKAGGTACNRTDLECASVKCLTDAGLPDGGACAPLGSLVKPEECAGP